MRIELLEILGNELSDIIKMKSKSSIILLICSAFLEVLRDKRKLLIPGAIIVWSLIFYTLYISFQKIKINRIIRNLENGFIKDKYIDLIRKIEIKNEIKCLELNNCIKNKEKKIWYIN